MSLTPEDIQSKQFHVRFRGFDVEEVDGFLEQVAENFLMLLEENRTLKAKIETMTQELEVFRQDETSFKNAILSAQKVVDEMKKKSRSEANRVVMQANAEVTQLKDEANREIAALEAKVDQLKGMQSKILGDLRGVLNGYLEQLADETLTSVEVRPQESAKKPEPPAAKRDADQSSLYEKITVDDSDPWLAQAEEDLQAQADEYSVLGGGGPTLGGLDFEESEPSVTIPDLDDEIMFTLEDPLDQEGGRRRR